MRLSSKKFAILAGTIVTTNIIGLAWIGQKVASAPKPIVRVVSARPGPEKGDPDRLTVLFDRIMVEPGSVGKVQQAQLFDLKPAWPGAWQWSRPDTLEYRLDEPLPPGRVFQLCASEGFQAATGKVIEGSTDFRFETARLSLEGCAIIAADNREVTLEMAFNQPVNPDALVEHATFCDDNNRGETATPICLTKKPDERLVLRVRRPASGRMRVVLDEQLTGHEAELSLGRKVTRTLSFSRRFSLLRTYVERPRFEQNISVRLRFSRPLNWEQGIPDIKVEPPVEKLNVHRDRATLKLSGGFEPGKRYTLEVPGTLSDKDGSTLGENKSVAVTIPDRIPSMVFTRPRGFISPLGNLTLDMKTTNVDAVELKSWRVHANNLVSHLQGCDVGRTSRLLPGKKIEFDASHNEIQQSAVSLQGVMHGGKGIYRVDAKAVNRSWTSARTLVTVTDLAITAKVDRDGCLVWLTSLRNGQPVSAAHVEALTYNNQRLAAAKTDESGIARLKYNRGGPDGDLWVITARKGDDLSYLRPDENQWVIDDVEQSGRPHAKNYEVMLYSERGVYRPGDRVHLTGIIRSSSGLTPPPFPLAVKIIRPDGKEVDELISSPQENGQGVFHTEFPTRSDGQTGPYRFEVTLPGSAERLGSTQALVEAFVPLRMEIKAEPSAERFGPNEPPVVAVTGRYLWDQPAAGLPVKIDGTLRATTFRSERFADFYFGTGRKSNYISLPTSVGKLDEKGRASIVVELPELSAAGLYRMDLSATVTELGGRSVSSNTSAVVDQSGHHIGLRLKDGRVVSVDKPVSVDWITLNGDDEPAPGGDVQMRLVRVEYDTVLKEVNRRHVWESIERTDEILTRHTTSPNDSQGAFEIACPAAGKYRVIVRNDKTGSVAQLDFHAHEDGSGPQSIAMDRPERLEIVTDRQTYSAGETAKVLVKSPFPGALLLTLETDRVVDFRTAEAPVNTAEFEVPLSEQLRGGAFITATIIRPVDPARKNWLPHRAMGMARINLTHESQRMPVEIAAPKTIGPGETASITVKTGPPTDSNRPAFVHIWAVDEGILLTSTYRTPDPMAFFFAPRRLGVSTADIFFRLLPDYDRPAGMTRIGSGGPANLLDALRRNPVPARERLAAVIWREASEVDPNGMVTIDMTLPDLIGQMRIMAVAVDQDRYGRNEHDLTVTAPLIAEASWPRFLAPGDVFEAPVKIFNSAGTALTVRLEAEVDGPIEMSADTLEGDIVVKPGEPVARVLHGQATAIGPVEVRIKARQTEAVEHPLTAVSRAQLTVRPATALHGEVILKTIEAGEQLKIEPSKSFIEGTARMKVSIGPRPGVQLEAALEQLVGYPYGCVEQTSSRLFALLYAAEILPGERADQINAMVQAGIARLWAMQTLSGGLSYWPGGTEPSEWGTAYASWCLMEARNAGHKVDSRFSEELAKYLEARLGAGDNGDNNLKSKALFCRVLSTFGRPPHGWLNLLAERKSRLDAAALAHLGGAFYAAGRKDRALALLAEQLPGAAVDTTTSGRLTSRVQQEAVLLSVLLEIDPNHPMTAPLAENIFKARQNGRWGSTLENSAAIVALSRYQAITSQEEPEYEGSIRLGLADPVEFDHTKRLSNQFVEVTEPIVISSTGIGKLYLAVTTEGLAVEGLIEPYNRQLTVTRRWLDKERKPVDPNSLRVGDLVHVEIEVRSHNERVVDNIAVVDALCGGMEVENPRLATSARAGRPQGARPSHVEFLDDRVVLFCSASSEAKVFRYALRATTAGRFDLPPIQASCMYDPAVASMGKSGGVTIRQ